MRELRSLQPFLCVCVQRCIVAFFVAAKLLSTAAVIISVTFLHRHDSEQALKACYDVLSVGKITGIARIPASMCVSVCVCSVRE